MKFIPTKEKETFYLPNFIMDNIIVFALSALIAFVIPAWGGRRRPELAMYLYNDHNHTKVFRNACMTLGILVSLIFCVIRLKKFHIYSLELKDHTLEIVSINLLNKKEIKIYDLSKDKLRFVFTPEQLKCDPEIKILDSYGQLILSTETSKYWEYKHDSHTLDKLKANILAAYNSKILVQ